MNDQQESQRRVIRKVVEESSELLQSLCHADRWGWFYTKVGHEMNNMGEVMHEVTDVRRALNDLDAFMFTLMKDQIGKEEKE